MKCVTHGALLAIVLMGVLAGACSRSVDGTSMRTALWSPFASAPSCPSGWRWMGAHCFKVCSRDEECPPREACVCDDVTRCSVGAVVGEGGDEPLRGVCFAP